MLLVLLPRLCSSDGLYVDLKSICCIEQVWRCSGWLRWLWGPKSRCSHLSWTRCPMLFKCFIYLVVSWGTTQGCIDCSPYRNRKDSGKERAYFSVKDRPFARWPSLSGVSVHTSGQAKSHSTKKKRKCRHTTVINVILTIWRYSRPCAALLVIYNCVM